MRIDILSPQNNSFNAESIPSSNRLVKLRNCYFEGTLSREGKREWKLVVTKFPKLSLIYRLFNSIGKKTRFIADAEFATYAKLASLKTAQSLLSSEKLNPILSNPQLKSFLEKNVIEIKEIKATHQVRWKRAIAKVMRLTQGSKSLFTKGYIGKPKLLDESYYQEAFDPKHHSGDLLHPYFNEWKTSDTDLSFEDYLTQHHISQRKKQVLYLNKEQRAEHEVSFSQNGHLMLQRCALDTKEYTATQTFIGNDDPIYVISPNGKVLIGSPRLAAFHHTSLLSAGAIIGAGHITTDHKGKILSLSNLSGHYKPGRKQLLATLRFLKSKNVDLGNVTLIEYGSYTKVFKDASQYLANNGIMKEDGRVSETGVTVYFDYNNQHLSSLILRNDQHSLFDKISACREIVETLSLEEKTHLKFVKIHNGQEGFLLYELETLLKMGAQAQPITKEFTV